MNTREQLINFRKQVSDHVNGRSSCLNADDIALLDKLIAERPYEPGDKVMHGGEVCYFYCVSPVNDCIYIIALPNGETVPALAENIEPLPKTYRVTVPEEVIDKARQITASRIDDVVAANEVCACIANPDNWEE